jgi:hypothetical protein
MYSYAISGRRYLLNTKVTLINWKVIPIRGKISKHFDLQTSLIDEELFL